MPFFSAKKHLQIAIQCDLQVLFISILRTTFYKLITVSWSLLLQFEV